MQLKALVQIRQVDGLTRTTSLQLATVLHEAAMLALHKESTKTGMDFYFAEHSHGRNMVAMLQSHFPCRVKLSRTPGSGATLAQHTHLVELCPLQKFDLVVLPKDAAAKLNLPGILLVTMVNHQIHLVNPLTNDEGVVPAVMYWRSPFTPLRLEPEEFIVLDIEPIDNEYSWQEPRDVVQDVEIARAQDFGVNDKRYRVHSHLGKDLKISDKVYGFDLGRLNCGWKFGTYRIPKEEMPDVLIIGTTTY
ncbi:60S ribosomal export protein nmd3 [Thraustotheca clavata]|uniref:60S ribosomal export protein NMD3 n=1 Tax=Thraustotheca clavata TaxID=74557 RepID=A0A1V9Y7T3_9STRA|nr:60S ribosomal export protein nmd3 [Thraustotheca clavata]